MEAEIVLFLGEINRHMNDKEVQKNPFEFVPLLSVDMLSPIGGEVKEISKKAKTTAGPKPKKGLVPLKGQMKMTAFMRRL